VGRELILAHKHFFTNGGAKKKKERKNVLFIIETFMFSQSTAASFIQ
jgi:hypothetical protein